MIAWSTSFDHGCSNKSWMHPLTAIVNMSLVECVVLESNMKFGQMGHHYTSLQEKVVWTIRTMGINSLSTTSHFIQGACRSCGKAAVCCMRTIYGNHYNLPTNHFIKLKTILILIKVHSNILWVMKRKGISILVLWELSSGLVSIDHRVLLSRLQELGIDNVPFKMFSVVSVSLNATCYINGTFYWARVVMISWLFTAR